MTSRVKAFRATEMCFMLPKYCKTFDSPEKYSIAYLDYSGINILVLVVIKSTKFQQFYEVPSISFQTFCTGIENCRRLLKIQYVIAIHFMIWLTNFYDFRFNGTATAGIGIHPTKVWLSQLVNFKNAIWTLEERYAIKFCFKLGKMPCDESWIYCYDPETKRQSSQWKHASSPRLKNARQSKSTHKLWWSIFFDSTGIIYMHSVPTVNKEFYVEVLREFRKRFRPKRLALFKSGQWHFH